MKGVEWIREIAPSVDDLSSRDDRYDEWMLPSSAGKTLGGLMTIAYTADGSAPMLVVERFIREGTDAMGERLSRLVEIATYAGGLVSRVDGMPFEFDEELDGEFSIRFTDTDVANGFAILADLLNIDARIDENVDTYSIIFWVGDSSSRIEVDEGVEDCPVEERTERLSDV